MAEFQWDDEAEQNFNKMFDELDIDGSGTLTFEEIKNGGLQQGACAVGSSPSDKEVQQFIQTIDKHDDDTVSKDEFRQFLADFLAMMQEQIHQAQQRSARPKQFEWNDKVEVQFREIFNHLDEDESGKLTFDEVKSGSLRKCAQLLGHCPTDADVYDFMDKLDVDGDGAITEAEFRIYLQEFIEKLQDPRKELKDAVEAMMKSLDKDGNELCSKEEFKAFIQSKGAEPLTDKEVDEIFSAVDNDGDKTTLNKGELLAVLQIGLQSPSLEMNKP